MVLILIESNLDDNSHKNLKKNSGNNNKVFAFIFVFRIVYQC